MGVFTFSKLYTWYQIAQSVSNCYSHPQFSEKYKISDFEHLNESPVQKDFSYNKQENHIVYYILVFYSDTIFPSV